MDVSKNKLKHKEMVSRLAPHLKAGLSIRKALLEAKISRATFYRYMQNDAGFREQIKHLGNYNNVLMHNAFFRQLITIVSKQSGNLKKGEPPQKLEKEDVKFLQWYVLNHKLCREEFGNRKQKNIVDISSQIYKVNETTLKS